jgi:hypothetical protein
MKQNKNNNQPKMNKCADEVDKNNNNILNEK